MPPYEDDNGIDINGGYEEIDSINIAPTSRIATTYNNNQVADGALVSGFNNLVSSGKGVIVTGNNNIVGAGASNISITSSTGVTVLAGISNVSVTNSSGLTIGESNISYNNGIKSYNNITYKKYIALLKQTGTNAPTATIIENTLTDLIAWTYNGVGNYTGTLTSEFTQYKTLIFHNNTAQGFTYVNWQNEDEIDVETWDTTGASANGQLDYMTIEIRVYN